MYVIGATYTRNDIYELLDVPQDLRGGDWLNGYHRHGSDYYIFCNIDVAGRTGHDYDNHWEGEKLVWHGKTNSHFGQQTIRNLASGDHRVFVFYRTSDRDPFTFAGAGLPIAHPLVERPARIDWAFGGEPLSQTPLSTDEYPIGVEFTEGTRTQVLVNRYERDRNARDACVAYFGPKCVICGFDFSTVFGPLGAGYIHVHHKVPVSSIGEDYVVDPIKDLVPVCPNCHAMIHRRNPPLTIQEIWDLLGVST